MPRKQFVFSLVARLLGRAIAALVLAAALSLAAAARDARSGSFDYFTLSLSWSPTYCDGPAGRDDRQQCGPGRRFAFVVHGLWPQYDSGWPENCATRESWVPDAVISDMLDVMPSKRLIIHEWKKHGSCSGLSIADYFAATRLLFEKIRIPARYLSPQAAVVTTPQQLVTDFVKTNRELTSGMISVQCGNARDRARLSELRVCIDRRGNFRQCGANESRQCRARTLILPPVR
ncbi:MAG: ribonuclease T2 [Alphaproteobacteria bacterium]|nr:ribonuclease T2 [Alphaproteobacteria bacterium]